MGAVSQLVSVEQDPRILIPKRVQIKHASHFFHSAKTAISWALPKFKLKPQPDPNRPHPSPPRCQLATTSPSYRRTQDAGPRAAACASAHGFTPTHRAVRAPRPSLTHLHLHSEAPPPPPPPRRHLGREPSAAAYVLAHGFNPKHRALRLTCAILRLLAPNRCAIYNKYTIVC